MKKKMLVSSLVILTLTNLSIYSLNHTASLSFTFSDGILHNEIDPEPRTINPLTEIDPEPRIINTPLGEIDPEPRSVDPLAEIDPEPRSSNYYV